MFPPVGVTGTVGGEVSSSSDAVGAEVFLDDAVGAEVFFDDPVGAEVFFDDPVGAEVFFFDGAGVGVGAEVGLCGLGEGGLGTGLRVGFGVGSS